MSERRRDIILFAVFFAMSAIATLPLSAALQWSGIAGQRFSARSLSGSLWSGGAHGAAIGSAALGDIRIGMSPIALLNGRAAFAFSPLDGAAPMPRGSLAVSSTSVELDAATASIPLSVGLGSTGAALSVQDLKVRFTGNGCAEAAGSATASVPLPDNVLPGVGSLSVTGTAICEGEQLLLPMTGQSAGGDIGLFMRIDGSGAYNYDLMLTVAEPTIGARLAASGFVADGGRFRLHGAGSL